LLIDTALPEDIHTPAARRRTVRRNLGESPVSWLAARGHITPRQAAAGALLRRDYEQAGLGARITMRWDPLPPSRVARGPVDPAGAATGHVSARQRFDGAMAAVGPGLDAICWRLICAGEPMAEAEKGLGWPKRSGRLVLTLALDRIAAYYRLP
jgi:hypothetical protein